MAKITLQILGSTDAQGNGIDAVIKKVKADLKSLEEPIKVKVDTANSNLKEASSQVEKLATNEEKLASQQTKVNSAIGQSTQAAGNAAKATKQLGDATAETAKKTESLVDNLVKFARWWAVGNVVTGLSRSLREALNTLKAVDSELVTIRKVTGFSDSQIAGIQEQAFATASRYGVGAADYLEGVAQFSRAGYKEQSAALAELSTKTQIVGDTTAETANQFLLSVDAAYKYKGSIEELSRVLDGANELDNSYATSISKIAEGMGIVAPVAAQMHVTVDELAASIGTITAVTQRSGTEAARALRALFLNIAGDTKTEIDEGVTWTTGEIEGLRDVIKQYASDAYEAAQATGSVIDPMEAIAGLAKSMQDGLLTEQQLLQMVSDIGGKLRTSQLLAIIQNWDMYQSMLGDYANAIGSADKEVANALDSWERKSEILKNTWTEFVQNFLNSDMVKDGLDTLIGGVELLNTDFGQFVITVGLVTGATVLLNKGFLALSHTGVAMFIKDMVSLKTGASTVVRSELAMQIATQGLGATIASLTTTMLANPLFWGAVAVVGIGAASNYIKNLTDDYTAQREELERLNSEYEKLTAEGSEYDRLLEKRKTGAEELTDAERRRLTILQAQTEELAKQRKEQERETWDAWNNMYSAGAQVGHVEDDGFGNGIWVADSTRDVRQLERYTSSRTAIGSEYSTGQISYDEYLEKLKALETEYSDYVDMLIWAKDNGYELTDAQEKMIDASEETIDVLYGAEEAQGAFSESVEETTEEVEEERTALQKLHDVLDDLTDRLSLAQTAFKDFDEDGRLSWSTLSSIIDKFGDLENIDDYVARLSDAKMTSGELREIMGQMAIDLIKQKIATGELTRADQRQIEMMLREIGVANADKVAMSLFMEAEWEAKYGADAVTDAVGEFNRLGLDTSGKVAAVKTLFDAFGKLIEQVNASGQAMRGFSLDAGDISSFSPDDPFLDDQTKRLLQRTAQFKNWTPTTTAVEWDVTGGGSGGGSGGGGGGGSRSSANADTTDKELERRKSIIELLKSELSIMEKRGDSQDKLVEKYREIQKALHDEAEYLRSIGADQKDINSLSAEWWDYEKKILDVQDEIVKNQEKLAADLQDELEDAIDEELEKAKEYRDNQIAAIDAEIDKIKERNAEVEKQNQLEQLKADILQKQNDLLKAQSERTVRIYNASTGQWEWVADQSAVNSAQEALDGAREKLSDFRREQAQDEEIAALEARKEAIERAYQDLEDEWKAITDSLKTPTRRIADILNDIAQYGTPELKAQVDRINELLAQLGLYSYGAVGSGMETAQSHANRLIGMYENAYGEGSWTSSGGAKDLIGAGIGHAFDSGGVLHGIGGIKATAADEMVLPPDVTAKMLAPSAGARFKTALSELRALYGGTAGIGGAAVNNSNATYNNGATYNLGGVVISEGQARSMSVYELAQRARALGIMNAG